MHFISLENCDNIVWGKLIEPAIITRLLNDTECDFLLDISHAYCTSKWLDMPFVDYLKKLPLERTVEVHINSWVQ